MYRLCFTTSVSEFWIGCCYQGKTISIQPGATIQMEVATIRAIAYGATISFCPR
ncbi:MAG: hypothetical protein H7320_16580 [Ferruginibacter sp.]|nr:hypothetical protein [Ferruginibacter sp.]